MANVNHSETYDVAVIGSGLHAGILGACLARNGARVIILGPDSHPRFRIGESTTFYTQMMFRLLAERYKVPELKWLASFEGVHSKITTAGGVKRSFGFIYHREDRPQDPREAQMVRPPRMAFTQNHYFRQDIDSWLMAVAAKYGTEVRQQQVITDVAIDDHGVVISRENQPPVYAKYVVDTDSASVLVTKFGLREDPCRFRVHSRSLYTHMMSVRPYDEIAPAQRYHNPGPWHAGTLHHLFHGGWMWVIPFDNHPRATNPLCSVGLQLDPRIHPEPDCPPDEEFRRFTARFPDLARQFERARPAQEWVRTGRVQYSSERISGHLWSAIGDAAGHVDQLFSGGLSIGVEIINVLTQRLLDAIKENDFSVKRFSDAAELEQGMLDFNDDLCANSYTAFQDFFLWDIWYRVWSLGQIMAHYQINGLYTKYRSSGDYSCIAPLENPWWQGRTLREDASYGPVLRFLQEANKRFQDIERGEADPGGTSAYLMRQLREGNFAPPIFRLGDPSLQWTDPQPYQIPEMVRWARKTAPAGLGKLALEGLFPFMRTRFGKGEFSPLEELKNVGAGMPVIRRRLQIPKPV